MQEEEKETFKYAYKHASLGGTTWLLVLQKNTLDCIATQYLPKMVVVVVVVGLVVVVGHSILPLLPVNIYCLDALESFQ